MVITLEITLNPGIEHCRVNARFKLGLEIYDRPATILDFQISNFFSMLRCAKIQ